METIIKGDKRMPDCKNFIYSHSPRATKDNGPKWAPDAHNKKISTIFFVSLTPLLTPHYLTQMTGMHAHCHYPPQFVPHSNFPSQRRFSDSILKRY